MIYRLACLNNLAMASLSYKMVLNINSWSLVQSTPIWVSLLRVLWVYYFRLWLNDAGKVRFYCSYSSVKNINKTSSSRLSLTLGLSFLIYFIWMISFSIRIDMANSLSLIPGFLVGTKTALSISLSTIFSCGTPIILWTAASLSKSISNLSSKSIMTLNSTCWVLSFFNSTKIILICYFDPR